MKILKLIGALIDYPADALWSHREELVAATTDPALAPHRREQLTDFIGGLLALEPMAAQERWLGLFDRGQAQLGIEADLPGPSRPAYSKGKDGRVDASGGPLDFTADATVPEPSTLVLFASGAAFVALRYRRR